MKTRSTILGGFALVAMASAPAAAQIELTNANRGFELGDTSGWVSFPSGSSTFDAITDANSGMFGGLVFNNAPASAAVIKQANLGIGQVSAGQEVTISFWAKGSGAVGGVAFAEFFSEIDGGGVSSSVLLGGAPLGLSLEYQYYEFTTLAGPDVSGGVTLQFAAVTGADNASVMELYIDDVSVSIIPAPGAAALLAGGALLAGRRRR